jgi:uroporphyrinogen-III synthase
MANETSKGGFEGLRVLSLESRRAQEMAKLIENNGGKATVAPSMREIPLASNTEAIAFARTLAEGGFDIVIFLTGVGTRALTRVVETVYPVEQFVATLRKITIVARGPKPVAALKELGVPVTIAVPEPNTWRDLLRTLDEKADSVPLKGRNVAVQEYGTSNPELLSGLSERGARVTRVPVYEWGLPENIEPLRAAVAAIARDEFDVILFTTGMQVNHLFQVAAEMNQEDSMRRGLSKVLIASIGPVTSERLHEFGLQADIEPTHPKMGYLVSETAQRSAEILQQKRNLTK